MIERLTPDELANHERLLRELAELEDLSRRLDSQRAIVKARWRSWVVTLHERYQLARDGSEGVCDDGVIVRVHPRVGMAAGAMVTGGANGELDAANLAAYRSRLQ